MPAEYTAGDPIPTGRHRPDGAAALLDAEHIDGAVLQTTAGLLWEAELADVELSQASV